MRYILQSIILAAALFALSTPAPVSADHTDGNQLQSKKKKVNKVAKSKKAVTAKKSKDRRSARRRAKTSKVKKKSPSSRKGMKN